MRTPAKLIAATAALTLGLASAALASGPSDTHGRSGSAPGHTRSQQTSSSTSTSTGTAPNSNAKAYGRLCQGESKKHVAGQKGTPFSKCVTDMAHLSQSSQGSGSSQTSTGSQSATNPARACANESKMHVAGRRAPRSASASPLTRSSSVSRATRTVARARTRAVPTTARPRAPATHNAQAEEATTKGRRHTSLLVLAHRIRRRRRTLRGGVLRRLGAERAP